MWFYSISSMVVLKTIRMTVFARHLTNVVIFLLFSLIFFKTTLPGCSFGKTILRMRSYGISSPVMQSKKIRMTACVGHLANAVNLIFLIATAGNKIYHKMWISLSQHANIDFVCSEIAYVPTTIMLQNYYT